MSRESSIEFERNYCQHYSRGKGADMVCKAGVDLKKVQNVPTGPKGIKWGPCIGGHTLANPTDHCACWIRRTMEQAETRADSLEKAIQRMAIVGPVVAKWRKEDPIGKSEIIKCPICDGHLHLTQSGYNGHVWGRCDTEDCVSWIE